MKIVIENAGAERGFMVLQRKGKLYVEAESRVGQNEISLLKSIPLEEFTELPAKIINYVAHTRETVILNKACEMGAYTNEPYIIKNNSKSILCFPILNRGEFLGILYLENNLSEYAFIPERLEVLKVLSSQAAISIENSLLYQNLEEKINERTEELKLANIKLLRKNLDITIAEEKIREKDRHKSAFLASMSHELRTPLNSINGIAELLRFGIYEKNEFLVQEIQSAINSLHDARDNDENSELSHIINNLKSIMDFIAHDGNIKQYFFLKMKEEFEGNNFLNSNNVLTSLIDKVLDILDTEEREIFNAYKRIKESGDYLLGLINSILNLSKIEAGKIEIKKSSISVKKLVESTMDTAISYAKSKQKERAIALHSLIDVSVPEYMILDEQKTKQVLLNYLSNAIKFTAKGEVKLSVQNRYGNIRFSVNDTGMGIKNEDKKRIFQEFERTQNTRNIEGTGLGLAISKKLIELQGGRTGFDSEFGKGSEFWFEIPVE